MRWLPALFVLTYGLFGATFLDDQVNDLATRIRRLAEKESQNTRVDTLVRLDRLLAGHVEPAAEPRSRPEDAAKLLDQLEHVKEDPAGYAELAALVRRHGISTGTDNPSVRARLALAELAELLRTDYDAVLPVLRTYHGRAVVLSFWATWCAPCQTEMPMLEKLHREGTPVIAISDEDPAVVKAFMTQYGYTLPTVHDGDRKVFTRFGISAMPALRILDVTGRVRVEAGEVEEPELRRLVLLRHDP